ncbi:sugar ABC transporter substrate-binding protein [Nitrospira sp.]|nr:sugar ABC transporter substrate-binding protein [Nitrospira sp.]
MRGNSYLPLAALLFASTLFGSALVGCTAIVQDREYDAPGDFLLGPEDVLEITVWKNQDLSRTTAIRPDGLISMPIIGDVQAAGLTADGLAKRIGDRLKQYVAGNPAVSVSVSELNSYSVYVLGEVSKPGKHQAKSYITVLQAISMSGGFTEYAKKNKMHVIRHLRNGDNKLHETRILVPYDDLLAGVGEHGNIVLLSGDTVVVP